MSTFLPQFFLGKLVPFFSSSFGIGIFIVVYALWVAFLMPASWLSMLAGFIYGSWIGSVVVFIGACTGAQISFFLARTLLRDWSQKKLSSFPKLQALEKALTGEGFKFVFLTRLSPLFPFSFLNLLYGISEVKITDFTLGLIGILPGTVLYCGVGALAGEVSNFSEVLSGGENTGSFAINILSTVSTLFVVWLVVRSARNVFSEFD